MEFDALVIALLGGVAIAGGFGSVIGMFFGRNHPGGCHIGGNRACAVAGLAVHAQGDRRLPCHRCANLGACPQKPVIQMTGNNFSTANTSFGTRATAFLRDNYIYFVLLAVVVVLSTWNLDQFALFERGNFLNKRNIINILRVSAPFW